MKIPAYSGNEYVDAAAFNTAAGLVSGDFALLGTTTALPGLTRNDAASFASTGLSMGLYLPAPFGVMFGNGVLAHAHGVNTGQDTSTYAVNLTGNVPASGSATIYMLASQYSIQQNAYGIPGPPPGHPSYAPTFVPYTAYATTVDSLQITASTTPANNSTTFELCRTVLNAGATSIGAIDTSHQWLTGPVAQINTLPVVGNKLLGVTDAGVIQRLDASGIVITLPPVASAVGRRFSVVQRAVGTSTVQTYDSYMYGAWGAPSVPLGALSLSTGQSIEVISDGQNWQLTGLSGDPSSAAGQILWFAAAAVPSNNYYVADGSLKSRTSDAALFGVIGTTFGSGDGLTTFALPNLLGQFTRGWNNSASGPDTGRAFGSTQSDAYAFHNHSFAATGAVTGTPTGSITGTAAGSVTVTGAANGSVSVTGTGTGTATFTGSGSGATQGSLFNNSGADSGFAGGLYTYTGGVPNSLPVFVTVTGSGTTSVTVSAAGTNSLPVTGTGVASLPVTGTATTSFATTTSIAGSTGYSGPALETRPTNVALLPCICRGLGSAAGGGGGGATSSTFIDLRNYTTLDGITDNTVAVQAWINLLASTGCIGTWIGTIKTTSPVYFPAIADPGSNSFIGGGVRIDACGRTASLWYYAGASGYALDDLQATTNNPGVRSGCLLRGFRMYGSNGPAYSTAAGGIRIVNWREGIVEDLQIDSFRYGAALTLYGMIHGDMQYVTVRNCQFGWWYLDRNQSYLGIPARLGIDDYWWCNYGVLYYGSADANGKCNENRIKDNDFYNCITAAICVSGYATTGNPGVPNPSQASLLGGGGYNVSVSNSLGGPSCKNLWTGTAGSGSTANTMVLGVANSAYAIGVATTNYFVDPTGINPIYVSMLSGVCAGQYGVVTAYASGSQTLTIQGTWVSGIPPASGDSLIIGYRSAGIMIDSDGSYGSLFDKFEQITDPYVVKGITTIPKPQAAGGVPTGNLSFLPLLVINSGGNGIVCESPLGPWTIQAVSGMLLTMPNTMSSLGGWYARNNGSTAQIISGTGSGQYFRVAAWTGSPSYQLTPTASSWSVTSFDASGNPNGVTPDTTSVIQFVPGAEPMLLSPQVRKNVLDYDSTNADETSNQLIDGLNFVSRYLTSYNNSNIPIGVPQLGEQVGLTKNGFNNTGHTIYAGDVLRASTGTATFSDTTGSGNTGCVVVGGLFGTESYQNHQEFPYGLPGCVLAVTMVSGSTAIQGNSLISASGNVATTMVNPTQEAFIGTLEMAAVLVPSLGKTQALVRIR